MASIRLGEHQVHRPTQFDHLSKGAVVIFLGDAVAIPLGIGPHGVDQQRNDTLGSKRHGFAEKLRAVGCFRFAEPVYIEDRGMGAGVSDRRHEVGLHGFIGRRERNITDQSAVTGFMADLTDVKWSRTVIVENRIRCPGKRHGAKAQYGEDEARWGNKIHKG